MMETTVTFSVSIATQHDFVNIQYFCFITCDSVCRYIHIKIYCTFTVKIL